MAAGVERTVGLIGCGTIAQGVMRPLERGQLPGWKLGAVLARSARTVDGFDVGADRDAFLAQPFDLIIEAAGPAALAALGPDALSAADVWAVSGTALVDDDLYQRLEAVGAQSGHRLRLLPGAIAGLDGVATTSVADDSQVHIHVDLVPAGDETSIVFNGSVRQAAARFPNHVNVAVATALAGLGLDRTEITVRQPKSTEAHTLRIETTGRDGTVDATTFPIVRPPEGIHIVSSSIIAALRAATTVIHVG